MPYKLPAKLAEYLKDRSPCGWSFRSGSWVKWAELYPYMDVQEMTWKRKKAALPHGADGQLQRLPAAVESQR